MTAGVEGQRGGGGARVRAMNSAVVGSAFVLSRKARRCLGGGSVTVGWIRGFGADCEGRRAACSWHRASAARGFREEGKERRQMLWWRLWIVLTCGAMR